MKNQPSGGYRKTIRTLIGLALVFVPASFQTAGVCTAQGPVDRPAQKITLVGHRGAAGLAPENTLAAFRRALDIGVDALETDALLSADGEVVLHHDFHLRPEITRTKKGKWLKDFPRVAIKDLTLAELKTYDVGRLRPNTGYARRFPDQEAVDGEPIPTLREVISLLKARQDHTTELWIEIKTSPEKPDLTPSPEKVADAVLGVLREEGVLSRTRILSFDWRSLVHAQRISPEVPTVYLSHTGIRLNNIQPGQPGASPWMAGLDVDDFNGSVPRAIKQAGGRFWAPQYKTITYRRLEEAQSLGIQVFVWTPDTKEEMTRLIEMGVDGIITNRPDILKRVIGGS